MPYLYLAFFNYPIAEDFGFAFQFQENNSFFALLKNAYLTMNGRYVANVFMFANPIAFNSFFWYKLYPILLLIFLLLSSFFLTTNLKVFRSIENKLIASLVFSLLYIHNLPIISEGLYWQTGSSIYFVGIIFTNVLLGLIAKSLQKNSSHIYSILSFFVLFLCLGFNEVLTLSITFFLGLASICFFKYDLPRKRYVFFIFLFALLFASIMILAPGNHYRQSMYNDANNIGNTIGMSIAQVGRFGFLWAASAPLICSSVFFFWVVKNQKENNHWLKNNLYINKWVAISLLPISILLCVVPPYWFTGILGQHRTLNVAYFFFLLTWFLNLIVWFDCLESIKNKIKLKQKLTVVAFVVGILFTGNGYYCFLDIFSGKAHLFKQEMDARLSRLKNAQINPPQKLLLKPIKNKPATLFVTDISKDPKFWTNQGYNQYFRLNSTRIYLHNKNE